MTFQTIFQPDKRNCYEDLTMIIQTEIRNQTKLPESRSWSDLLKQMITIINLWNNYLTLNYFCCLLVSVLSFCLDHILIPMDILVLIQPVIWDSQRTFWWLKVLELQIISHLMENHFSLSGRSDIRYWFLL